MRFEDDDEMMDCGDGYEESFFTAVEWPSQQSTWLSHSKPLVRRPAVSGFPDVEESSSWFGGDIYTRPLVLRPAISGVLDAERASSQVVWGNRTKSLVLRPAVPCVPATEEASPQAIQKTRMKSLCYRPAIRRNPKRHDIAEEARIRQLQSTLPYRPRVNDKSHDSRRRYKEVVRKWTERKREREEIERRKQSESRGSDRFGDSHHEIDPAIIKQEIQDIPAGIHRAVGNDEHETLRACILPSNEWPRLKPISETKISTDTLTSALVAEIMKERQHVDEVKDFVNKKHSLEEWQNWGKILAERIDKGRKNWEEYKEMKKKEESRDHGGQKSDESTRGELARGPLVIQSVYYCLEKLDRALEEAENRLLKTHCESKEAEKESAEQRAAKLRKEQFVKRRVRDYVDSDSDNPSAMGPAKRKQLPLRQKNTQNSHAR
ncbi:uncharacterized protein EAE97_009127 [Botrytis byssoidea]|uniref:Uncharacterized protein n=1 Tax=Botrytis byssoidea TaxID=139641 RepID=A0A9P5M0M1_9HELO|nr:uncharacterized protein EAE97_009127 [Botrytis byssoidea]KAF7932106.1 hypothetical protein EAE97_009127 [Botrytis byssoidea]